jgi:hypothetical protein
MGSVFEGKFRSWTFQSLPGTQYEPNGIQTTFGALPSATVIKDPSRFYQPPDLRPRADSNIIDAAISMPNVNDASDRSGADIGAFEADQPLPIYGPRP